VKSQLVFQEKTEIGRLAVQNELLLPYETPVFEKICSGRTGLRVLDVGCNDGRKTAMRFSRHEVTTVIGLEYNALLVEQAQKDYGGNKFSFCHLDVEAPDFEENLRRLMVQHRLEAFDVIYLSFLLMHLRRPDVLLQTLRQFLAPGGYLVIVEADDASSTLMPRGSGLLAEFLDILQEDPYSGNREFGKTLPELLTRCGYMDIIRWNRSVAAEDREQEKKEAIFETFFSYLPEDLVILRQSDPENLQYRQWENWMDHNFDDLKTIVLSPESRISMGMQIISCRMEQEITVETDNNRCFYLEPMKEAELTQAQALCDRCVGKNLYSRQDLERALQDPDHFFCLLKTQTGETAGYVYWLIETASDLAECTGLEISRLPGTGCNSSAPIGKIQSVGLESSYWGWGLAPQMISCGLEGLKRCGIQTAFVVCWKKGNHVPLHKAVSQCGFVHLATAERIWYNHPNLVCPHCGGRCECDAEIYFKDLA